MSDRAGLRAAVLLIGNELLTGKIEDRNGRTLIADLRACGVELCELRLVGDNVELIAEAIRALTSRYDVVFSSGGVGPTHDDVTMEAVGRAFEQELVVHPELDRRVRKFFGRNETEARVWAAMARVPERCELIFEDLPWPVHKVDNLWILPGVPQIFDRQWRVIRPRFAGVAPGLVTLFLSLEEGFVAEPLAEAARDFPGLSFGSYPVFGTEDYRTRVTIEGRDSAAVGEASARLCDVWAAALVRREGP